MLSVLGFAMVAVFMTLIMTGRMAPLVALILVPVVFGLAAGHGLDLGPMMLEGVRKIAPTGVMIMFAILYFGLMIDAGLFDPVVRGLLRVMRGDPVRVVVGSVVLAVVVSLDGDGSTAYMVCVAALLPLYRRIGLDPRIMACLLMLSSGVMNLIPWGGPTARAASALQVDVDAIFLPLIPVMAVGVGWLLLLAWFYGRRERQRLGVLALPVAQAGGADEVSVSTDPAARRPRLVWLNGALTVGLLLALVSGVVPLAVLFMAGFALAAVINYPRVDDLRARIAAHAPNAIAMVALIFAAGVFTGILAGTGMVEAMPKSLLALISPQVGPYMAPITAVLSLPMTFFISNDAFYFGVLPVLAEAGGHYGISREAIGAASLIGQPFHLLSPLVPSTYLLVSLAGVEFGAHQRFTFGWAVATCAVLALAAVAFGVFPMRG